MLKRRIKNIISSFITVALFAVLFINMFGCKERINAQEVSFRELSQLIEDDEIQTLYLDGYSWTGYTINPTTGKVVAKYVTIGSELYSAEGLSYLDKLIKKGIQVNFSNPN